MHPARPRAELRPCPACGKPTDTLRAARIVLLEDGTRYLCSAKCLDAFRGGERNHEPIEPAAPRPSVPQRVREATRPRIDLPTSPRRTAPGQTPVPVAGASAALAALVASAFPAVLGAALTSAALTVAAAAAALHHARGMRRDIGLLPWIVGPAGAMLAACAGLAARFQDEAAWTGLAGAALAGGAMVARSWLDRRTREPVDAVIHDLLGDLPARVRIPSSGEGGEVRYEEVPTRRVRTGEEILAVEGEVIGVDGIVQGGAASVLLHPGAQTPSPRAVGDSVLAGARVKKGAIRIRSTRVGDERALTRLTNFGSPRHGAARVVRLAERVTRLGGVLALIFAVVGLALTGDPGLAGQLSAAAAVLIAAPLLSARRCAETPLIAAAAAAGTRGIVFHDARTLEDAGRVATVALCASGTVTENRSEVVEVHVVGDGDANQILALAAGAEATVAEHRLAKAIHTYARARHVTPATVRRSRHQPGRGVTAQTPEGDLVIGNRALLLEAGVSVALADSEASRAEERGQTALFVGLAGRIRGVIALRDEMHIGSRAAVQRMFDQQIEVVLLSGNHRTTIEAIAKHLDVSHVKAELLPKERGAEIQRLRESGSVVGVVGRHNDHHAVEAADVAVVLGAAGGLASEGAVATTSHDVRDAAAALWIARAARSEALRGVLLAVGAGGPLVAGAALGWIVPGVAALFSIAIDVFALPVGARLLRRIERRVPTR